MSEGGEGQRQDEGEEAKSADSAVMTQGRVRAIRGLARTGIVGGEKVTNPGQVQDLGARDQAHDDARRQR